MLPVKVSAAHLGFLALQVTSVLSQVAAPACSAKCTVSANAGYKLDWYPLYFNTTITAATVVQVVNTDLHTTRLSTIFNEIPAGYVVPSNTNEKGTQTTQVVYTRHGKESTTAVAFPTPFYVFPQWYKWQGVLETTDSNGRSLCATTSGATVSVDYYSQPETITAMPTHKLGPDPGGLYFKPTTSELTSVIQTYASAFPSEAALRTCSYSSVFPFVADYTARFVTDTSTSFEGGTSTPAPKTSSKSSTPRANSAVKTTQSVRTVVTEGTDGPTTVVETIQVTYAESTPAATANIGSSIAAHGMLVALWLGMMLVL